MQTSKFCECSPFLAPIFFREVECHIFQYYPFTYIKRFFSLYLRDHHEQLFLENQIQIKNRTSGREAYMNQQSAAITIFFGFCFFTKKMVYGNVDIFNCFLENFSCAHFFHFFVLSFFLQQVARNIKVFTHITKSLGIFLVFFL